jgi:hypothetical protein
MTDERPARDGDSAVGWVIAALIVTAIVLLVLFARGPEDQERSSAPAAVAAIVANT